MKKIFTLLTVLMTLNFSLAQPVLNRDSLRTGMSFTLYSLSNVNTANLRAMGPNVLWDLSSSSSAVIGTVDFLEMSSTPYAIQYPEANFAMKFTINSAVSYSLFKLSAVKMEEVGNNVSTSGGVPFINYRTALVFPFTYTLSDTDDYQKTGQGTKTIYLKYDAYGTFNAAGATSTNVMRILTVDNGDTAANFWGSSPCVPVFTSSVNNNSFIYWKLNTPVNLIKVEKRNQLQIYPNPTSEIINLACMDQIDRAEIYNPAGKLQMVSDQPAINISILAPGIYYVRAITKTGTSVQKLIIR